MINFKKYISIIPLLGNLAVVYIGLPLISSSQDQEWGSKVIIILSFFGLAASLQFGIPLTVVRSISTQGSLNKSLRAKTIINCLFVTFICGFFLQITEPSLWWLLLFAPTIFFVGIQRAVWEGSEKFFTSYLARMLTISIAPLLIGYTLNKTFALTSLTLFSLLILAINIKMFWSISNDQNKNKNNDKNIMYYPYLMQSLAATAFIYSDRYIAGLVMDTIGISVFFREFEMIYRLSAPVFVVASLLFPSLSSSDPKRIYNSTRELRFCFWLWFPFCFLIVPILAFTYHKLGFFSTSDFMFKYQITISFTILFIGISILLQRVLLAFGSYRTIFMAFFISGLITTIGGGLVTYIYSSAVLTLALKSALDLLIVSAFISKFSYFNPFSNSKDSRQRL